MCFVPLVVMCYAIYVLVKFIEKFAAFCRLSLRLLTLLLVRLRTLRLSPPGACANKCSCVVLVIAEIGLLSAKLCSGASMVNMLNERAP